MAKRRSLSAAHRAAISASLRRRSGKSGAVSAASSRAKGRASAVSKARTNLRAKANAPASTYNRAVRQLRAVSTYRKNVNPKYNRVRRTGPARKK